MNLLAKSCFAPGLITLIGNLVSSQGQIDTDKFEEDWLKEYANGMGYEIYRVRIDERDYQNCFTFGRIAEIVLNCYSTIVFALEIEGKDQNGQIHSVVRLNPTDFEICDWHIFNFYLFLICEDASIAQNVQKLEMTEEKYFNIVGAARGASKK